MIYCLLIISVLLFAVLKSIQKYYEYFTISALYGKGLLSADKPKFNLFILFLGIKKSYRPNWVLVGSGIVKRNIIISKSLSKFLLLFSLSAALFVCMQFWIDHTTDVKLTNKTIREIEEIRDQIKIFIDYFKIVSDYDIFIFLGLILLVSFFPVFEKWKLKDKVKRFNKVISTCLTFLTICSSFTFFGANFSEDEIGKDGLLVMHELQIIKNNKLLIKDIQEALTEKVIDDFLQHPSVNELLEYIDEIEREIEKVKEEDEYRNFSKAVPASFVQQLSITKFYDSHKAAYDFNTNFHSKMELYAQEISTEAKVGTEGSFYAEYKKSKPSSYEADLSYKDIYDAQATFNTTKSEKVKKTSPFYNKYKDVIHAAVDRIWDKTGKSAISEVFRAMEGDFPFLYVLVNVLVQDPLKDFIKEKTKSIFELSMQENVSGVAEELNKFDGGFDERLDQVITKTEKFDELKRNVKKEHSEVTKMKGITHNEIAQVRANARAHLQEMCSHTKWEGYRQRFRTRLKNGNLSLAKGDDFLEFLNEWESHKNSEYMHWYTEKKIDIEDEFFTFIENDNKRIASWGRILQEEELDGGLGLLSIFATPAENLLQEYFVSTHKTGRIVIDNGIKSSISELCLCPL